MGRWIAYSTAALIADEDGCPTRMQIDGWRKEAVEQLSLTTSKVAGVIVLIVHGRRKLGSSYLCSSGYFRLGLLHPFFCLIGQGAGDRTGNCSLQVFNNNNNNKKVLFRDSSLAEQFHISPDVILCGWLQCPINDFETFFGTLFWIRSQQPWCNPLWLTGLKAPTN